MINDVARRNVHVDAANNIPVAVIKEYDDFILKLNLMKYNTPFDVTGQTAVLGVKAPTGLFEQSADITINKNQVDIKLKKGIVSKAGTCAMELELVDSTGSMTTASFFIVVNRRILNDGALEASDEFDSLTKAVQKINADYEALKGGLLAEDKIVYFQDEVNKTNARISEIVAHNGDGTKDTELIDARKGKISLRKKIDEMDLVAEENTTQIADITKQVEGSTIDQNGVTHKTIDNRLDADYAIVMDRFNDATLLPYEAEYITASNSYKGLTEDLVIKGKTLQNLNVMENYRRGGSASATNTTIDSRTFLVKLTSVGSMISIKKALLKDNTTYSIFFKYRAENMAATSIAVSFRSGTTHTEGRVNIPIQPASVYTPLKCTVRTTAKCEDVVIGFHGNEPIDTVLGVTDLIVIEGDYLNKPVPTYFEGIKSVNEDTDNMEIISCDRNLFSSKLEPGSYHSTTGAKVTGENPMQTRNKDFVRVEPNTEYCISQNGAKQNSNLFYYDNDYKFIGKELLNTFTTPSNCRYVNMFWANTSVANDGLIQLEKGKIANPYEPYEENRIDIKMKNLRSLPNGVRDTSNGIRRVKKLILNGSESWLYSGETVENEEYVVFNTATKYRAKSDAGICDKLVVTVDTVRKPYMGEGIYLNPQFHVIYVRVKRSSLVTIDAAGFKAWLSQNPLTFYYEQETSETEEGNTEQIRTYDGQTSIFSEGSPIEPIISCKVPSNIQAVVSTLRLENEELNNEISTLQATEEENNLVNIETGLEQDARLTILELGL